MSFEPPPLSFRLLHEFRIGRRVRLALASFPFAGHAEEVADEEKILEEMLWSQEPAQAGFAAWMRQHPRRKAVILHFMAALAFLLQMVLALFPVPRMRRMWRGLWIGAPEPPFYFLQPPAPSRLSLRVWVFGLKWLRLVVTLIVEEALPSRWVARMAMVYRIALWNTQAYRSFPVPKIAESGLCLDPSPRKWTDIILPIEILLGRASIAQEGVDPDSLVAWRVAELRAEGQPAIPCLRRNQEGGWQIMVMRSEDTVERPEDLLPPLPRELTDDDPKEVSRAE